MPETLLDRTPYIKYADGTKDEIMFTARNVNMYGAEETVTVQEEIEALKEQISHLTEIVETIQTENTELQSALKEQMEGLSTSLESVVITKEKIIEALGFTPAKQTNWTVFKGATEQEVGSMGLVPQPDIPDKKSFLCGDGTWKIIDLDSFLTKTDAQLKYLGIRDKAVSAGTADIANTAYNIPYTAEGNIWIRENN